MIVTSNCEQRTPNTNNHHMSLNNPRNNNSSEVVGGDAQCSTNVRGNPRK